VGLAVGDAGEVVENPAVVGLGTIAGEPLPGIIAVLVGYDGCEQGAAVIDVD
jgi:hypothetical protein